MSRRGLLRVHLLWGSGDSWDLEQSVFSLLGQEGVAPIVWLHASEERIRAAEECRDRLGPLNPGISLALAPPGSPLLQGDEAAVAVWNAGTVATPDHFARCLAALEVGPGAVVAPMRRMAVRPAPSGPPFVLRKQWRWTSRAPSLAEVVADPAFLGRCLVGPAVAPDGVPADFPAQRTWAAQLWARTSPRRVEGPPTVDLPDLREADELTSWRDVAADLRYQLPRSFERMAPLAFQRTRRLFHLLRGDSAR